MENIRFVSVIKGLLHMLTKRVEKLEKRLDELEEEQRATSNQEFKESKRNFNKELTELDRFT